MSAALGFVPYHRLDGRPSVIVDGSPAAGTVLTLTHWPGFPAPLGLAADLSAQMALAYVGTFATAHGDATAVSNNHFDQDGLVSVLAMTRPAAALDRHDLLVDVAAAGDFGTYRHRTAARVSMVVARWADAARSPLPLPEDPEERCAALYEEGLARVLELCDHPHRFRDLWGEEDAALAASERAIASGRIGIDEHADVDLAVVDVPNELVLPGGHRFAHEWVAGLHPMAINNAIDSFAVLLRQGRRYEVRYRYESWIQYRSRPVRARRDLATLATRLTELETDGVAWTYDGSGALAPTLTRHGAGESAIAPAELLALLRDFLARAPADWDPFAIRS